MHICNDCLTEFLMLKVLADGSLVSPCCADDNYTTEETPALEVKEAV